MTISPRTQDGKILAAWLEQMLDSVPEFKEELKRCLIKNLKYITDQREFTKELYILRVILKTPLFLEDVYPQELRRTEYVLETVCNKGEVRKMVVALEQCGNEHLIGILLRWLGNELLSSYLEKIVEIYKSSPGLLLSPAELERHHEFIIRDLEMDPVNFFLPCLMIQVRRFYEFISKSWERWRGEWRRRLESISVQRGEALAQALNSADWTEVANSIEVSHSPSPLAHEFASAIVKDMDIFEFPKLTQELEVKLTKHIEPEVQTMENLTKLMLEAFDTIHAFKVSMVESLNKSICLNEDQFREATQKARGFMQTLRAEVDNVRLLAMLHQKIEQYEAELRLFNEKRLEEEQRIAFEAAQHSLQILAELLSPVEEFDVMTNSELAAAYESILAVVMYTFTSVRGFRYSPPWDSAADKIKKEADAILKHLLRENRKKMRRWDRLSDSARRRCFEFYDQLMNERLPSYKITSEELDSCHCTCASGALERFRVEEVNEPTRRYLKSLLEVMLEEFKQGFIYLNEEKPEVGEKYGADDQNKRHAQSRPSTQYSGKPPG